MKSNELLRLIPKVDEILNNEEVMKVIECFGRKVVRNAIREVADEMRSEVLASDNLDESHVSMQEVLRRTLNKIEEGSKMNLRKAINATGVILHTNLGRAPLSGVIKDKIWEIAEGYSTLEFDISTGERGSRYSHVEKLITSLTGAESALVVNNNAAAVMLALGTLAKDKKVIASRGELVEIGGSFRIPEIMQQSGATLLEVGTTNRTRISDYEKEVGKNETDEIGALLKVHTSNFKIVGFTEEVLLEDMVKLGKDKNIPVIYDLGSGALVDLKQYGIDDEMSVLDSVKTGVDVVCFSGDKLLGGPQAGIILGKKDLIDKMKKNPLTRAFRIDKLTLAALEAVLRIYINADDAASEIPVLNMLSMNKDDIVARAKGLQKLISKKASSFEISLEDDFSQAGGGTLPLLKLPTNIITVSSEKISAEELETRLRNGKVPIITRINKGKVCIDVRTVSDEDFELIVEAFSGIL